MLDSPRPGASSQRYVILVCWLKGKGLKVRREVVVICLAVWQRVWRGRVWRTCRRLVDRRSTERCISRTLGTLQKSGGSDSECDCERI